MSNTIIFAISALFAYSAINLILGEPIDEQKAEHKSYCELVSMWEEDTELGIEPTNRDGMPNYKEIDCEL